jgi:hypothetical protein
LGLAKRRCTENSCRATIEITPFQSFPRSGYLFHGEIVQENGYTVEKSFQSFVFPNTKTTFPIPFALNIDSPKDCPKELKLYVTGSHRLGFHYEYPLNGLQKISLEKFESIRVYRPTF